MKHKNDNLFNAKLYSKQKFGFRKLSIGLSAVALGTSFLFVTNNSVQAAASNNQLERNQQSSSNIQPTNSTLTIVKSSDINTGVSAQKANEESSVTNVATDGNTVESRTVALNTNSGSTPHFLEVLY
ncbi:YSIRK-type signal peptide-containing protein [Lactobacillus xujianguonis]|uniref:YSIRK-type signal peptide-containing protein n=1 Tax=Lactobacillus xujianguonis TaxID=2495899 RepID=A0A437SSN8_9LACO|nr:YSIRK-type signal peptide-containing protein [Lactobacillus xujianguonis]RVU69884.1 YSIRK-type signal peptide-containing protein [Lactobacillus xujianguonis]